MYVYNIYIYEGQGTAYISGKSLMHMLQIVYTYYNIFHSTHMIYPPELQMFNWKWRTQSTFQSVFVTEFWKITHMGAPETIRIFEFSMALLIAETTFKTLLVILAINDLLQS